MMMYTVHSECTRSMRTVYVHTYYDTVYSAATCTVLHHTVYSRTVHCMCTIAHSTVQYRKEKMVHHTVAKMIVVAAN